MRLSTLAEIKNPHNKNEQPDGSEKLHLTLPLRESARKLKGQTVNLGALFGKNMKV
jgi:hypothetical protein